MKLNRFFYIFINALAYPLSRYLIRIRVWEVIGSIERIEKKRKVCDNFNFNYINKIELDINFDTITKL